MARIFKQDLSLRKVVLVCFETILLTAVIMPISEYEAFSRLINGLPHEIKGAGLVFEKYQLLGFLSIRVLFIVLVCQICFFLNDLYNWKITANPNKTYMRLLESVSYSLILTALSYYAFQGLDHYFYGREFFGLLRIHTFNAIACMALVYFVSYYYRIVFHWTLFRWKLADRLMMIGINPMTDLIAKELKDREDPSYEIAGYIVKDPSQKIENRRILGDHSNLYQKAKEHNIVKIIVSNTERDTNLPINELLNCRIKGIQVEEATLLYERITGKIALEKLDPTYLIFSEGFDQFKFTYVLKRLLDLSLSMAGLILSFPILILTSIIIKLDSRGPIFFKQKRVGKEGKIFTLIKFRSMRSDAEEKTGPVWATKDDDRITRVGRIIRKLRIDEIPQVLNVLRNEMSFVGPRPERPFFVDELKQDIPYYTERLVVKPGITGWAQINYNYGASAEDALQKLQFDLYYIKNMSIFLDIITLLRTIKVVIRREGAV